MAQSSFSFVPVNLRPDEAHVSLRLKKRSDLWRSVLRPETEILLLHFDQCLSQGATRFQYLAVFRTWLRRCRLSRVRQTTPIPPCPASPPQVRRILASLSLS